VVNGGLRCAVQNRLAFRLNAELSHLIFKHARNIISPTPKMEAQESQDPESGMILIGLERLSVSNSELEHPEPPSGSTTPRTRGGYYNIPPIAPYDDSHMAINSNANMYSNFLENSTSSTNLAALPRQAPSPTTQHQPNQANGGAMAGMNVGMPMNAGQQMDLNHLYEKVQELSDVLRTNREKTKVIIKSAEEVMVSFI
jgi:hypothetical protein